MLVIGLGAAGVAVTKILLDGRRAPRHRRRLARRGAHRARGLPRRLDERDQALVRRGHQPRAAAPAAPADVIDGMDLFIGLSGRARHAARGARAHGARRDGLRDGQPEPRGHARGGRAVRAASWPRGARTTPTRSTTCSPSPASSAARSTCARAAITEEMKVAAARGDRRHRRRRPSCARTTSSRRSSTATSPRRWPTAVADEARGERRRARRQHEVGFAPGDARHVRPRRGSRS